MLWLDQLAEKRIEQAIGRGEFDNLPGAGQPLPEEDMTLVAEEERMAYRILKNAGYIPPELEMHKQAVGLSMQIATAMVTSDCAGLERQLTPQLIPLVEKLARINLLLAERGCTQLMVPPEYLNKLVSRF